MEAASSISRVRTNTMKGKVTGEVMSRLNNTDGDVLPVNIVLKIHAGTQVPMEDIDPARNLMIKDNMVLPLAEANKVINTDMAILHPVKAVTDNIIPIPDNMEEEVRGKIMARETRNDTKVNMEAAPVILPGGKEDMVKVTKAITAMNHTAVSTKAEITTRPAVIVNSMNLPAHPKGEITIRLTKAMTAKMKTIAAPTGTGMNATMMTHIPVKKPNHLLRQEEIQGDTPDSF